VFFRLFKSNHPLVFLYLLLYALLIKGSFFLLPHTYDYDVPGILASPLFNWLSSLGSDWQIVIHLFSILMVYTQAIAFNQFLIVDRIIQVQNYIPALLFLTLSSLHPEVLTLNPANLAYILVIPVFYYVFQLPYIQEVAVEMMFYAGLFIGLVSLLYFPSAYLIFPLLLAIAWLRGIYLREFLTPLIGFLMPYIIGGVAMYVMGNLPQYWSMLEGVLPKFSGFFVPKADQLVIGSIVGILTLVGFIRAYSSARENIIFYRKLLGVISLFIITGLAYFLFINKSQWLFGYLLLMPVSLFISNLYDSEKTGTLLRWLFWLMVLLALFFQWQYYLEIQGLTVAEWLEG
jgi:hypothetical protein